MKSMPYMRSAVFLLLGALTCAAAAQSPYPPVFEGARSEIYKPVGDTKLALYIFEPATPGTNRAAIVFFFGGGWQSGSPAQFEQQCRHFAARGMVAITADYRVGSRHKAKAADCVADAKSCVRWIRQNAARLGIDPQRIVAAGGSAGGHIAACTATVPGLDDAGEDTSVSAVPNALVLFNPALVLAPVEGLELKGFGVNLGKERLGTEPASLSPAHHIRPGTPPTLILHGKADTTVPFVTAEAFASAMKKSGNRCELIGYANQQHGFFNYGRGDGRCYRETLEAADLFLVSLGYLPAPPDAASKAERVQPNATAPAKPNIVFILADDLGYGDLGCYNRDSKISTPNLDRLAAEGLRFTDAHAPDAVCTPTRYGLLTGRYCFRSRMKSGVLSPWGAPLIEEGRLTVPALLRQHGYATACIGKWHLGWQWPTKDGLPPSSRDGIGNVDFSKPIASGPTTRGFDTYFGVDLPNYPPYCFIENDRAVGMPSVAAPMTKGGFNRPGPMVSGWNLTNIMPEITACAVRYVESAANSSRPFFLYFPLTAPHYPVVPTAEFKGRSKAGEYGDFVAQVDATVGAVLAVLTRTRLATNTLVIFTSDNGPECVEIDPGGYQRIRDFDHRSMDGLRGVKRDTWEGGHRVPFVARWPGHVPAGAVSEETICHVDFMATCAALVDASLPPSAGEDSYNILPILLGEKRARPIREATVLHGGSGKFAIRQGEWVLIDARSGDGNGQRGEPAWFKQERGYTTNAMSGELYNLRDDLAQQQNLYGEKPEIVERLKALLEKYKADGRSTPGPPQNNDSALNARKKGGSAAETSE